MFKKLVRIDAREITYAVDEEGRACCCDMVMDDNAGRAQMLLKGDERRMVC